MTTSLSLEHVCKQHFVNMFFQNTISDDIFNNNRETLGQDMLPKTGKP